MTYVVRVIIHGDLDGELLHPVFAALFLLTGSVLIVLNLVWEFSSARYTLTDRRLVIEIRGTRQSACLEHLPPPLSLSARLRRHGSVKLGDEFELTSIADAPAVCGLIADAQRRRRIESRVS
ncbi:hypothetical protein ACIBH1_28435 [Nonomuraea sp. NPDC050663]|uniref:hypothetical protein n=1 Tax=Nonomuraea sp. NPDC050663 TaxID=3364370 RepID=UPI00379760AB